MALYLKFNVDRAKNDTGSMEQYLAGPMLNVMQSEINARRHKDPNVAYKWESKNDIKMNLISLRIIPTSPNVGTEVFLQIVYKLTSEQKVTAVNKKTGEEAGGTPFIQVVDYFGFEKDISKDGTNWQIVQQLHE